MSKITVIADSTQIDLFMRCPQAWYYGHRLGIQPRESKTKEAILIGSYGHKLFEVYYKHLARSNGNPLATQAAIKEACGTSIDATNNCECGHAASSHVMLMNKYSVCSSCAKTDNYMHEYKPKKFPLSEEMRQLVRERFMTAALIYGTTNQEIRPTSPDTVEVGFSELIYEDDQFIFVLEGKIDLIGKMGNEPVIMDHKWQVRASTLYPKSIQFRNYSMISGLKLLLINYVRMAKTADRPLQRVAVPFSSDEHTWWRSELVRIFKKMALTIESANKYETVTIEDGHNWSACSGQYNEPCPYTNLCEERGNDHIKLIKINNTYTKKDEWKPW